MGDVLIPASVAELVEACKAGISADPWRAAPNIELDARISLFELARRAERTDAAETRALQAEAEVTRLRTLFATEHGWYAATPHLRSIAECVCADIASEDRPCVTCEAHGFVSALETPH